MRTFENIRSTLSQALNSPVWNSLKRGLLGQEVLNQGAHSIYQSDRGFSNFFRNFFPDTADLKGLLYQSVFYEVPLKNYIPAYLKIEMPKDGGVVYAPYTLIVKAGALSYTNISYVRGSTDTKTEVATFYQGRLYCTSNLPASERPDLGYRGVIEAAITGDNFCPMSNDINDLRTQTILFEHSMPESLKIFVGRDQVPVTELTGVSANKDNYNYRIYTDLDKTLRLQWGDGFFSKPLNLIDKLSVYHLELTFNKYNNTFIVLSYPNTPEVTIEEKGIVSQFDGVRDSLESARASIAAGIAKRRTVATRNQILEFARTSPEILGVIISGTSANEVQLKVKPRSFDDYSFEGLESDLQLYGELVTAYSVQRANNVRFSIQVRTLGNPPQSAKEAAEAHLKDMLHYDKIGFNENISEAVISDELRDILSMVRYSTRIIVEQDLEPGQSAHSTDLSPAESSVQVIDADGNQYAWDRDGRMVGFLSQETIVFDRAFEVGDFILLKRNSTPTTLASYQVLNPVDGRLTAINISVDLEAVVMAGDRMFASHNLPGGEKALAVFSLEGWKLTDLQNVSKTATSLVQQGDVQIDGTFNLEYFQYSQYVAQTNTLFLPVAEASKTQVRAYQFQVGLMLHVASYAISDDVATPPIHSFCDVKDNPSYLVFHFTDSTYNRAIYAKDLSGTSPVGATYEVEYGEGISANHKVKHSLGRLALLDPDGVVSNSEYLTASISSPDLVKLSVGLANEVYTFEPGADLISIVKYGQAFITSSISTSGTNRIMRDVPSDTGDTTLIESGVSQQHVLTDVGIISYLQRVIEFNEPLVEGLILEYSAAESLAVLAEKFALYTENVRWEAK